jgi:hypothetical protein
MKRKRDETGDNNPNVLDKKLKLQETDNPSQEETESESEKYEYSDLPMDVYHCTELHHAAEKGDAQKCREILAIHPKAVNDTTDIGYRALDLAVMGGHVEACVGIMSEMTYKQIYENFVVNTPLELIVEQEVLNESHFTIFEKLIYGLKVNDIKEYTKELLLTAVSKGHATISKLIIKENPEAIKEVRSFNNYLYNAALIASAKDKELVKSLISYIPVKDLYISFYMEQYNKKKHAESLKLSTAPCDYISTLFKDVSQMVSDHICTHDTATYPTIEQGNFAYHFKMLNLYSSMIEHVVFKEFLEESRTSHKEHFARVDDYIVENYFMLTGVCKNIQITPLYYVNSFIKQIVSIVLKQLHETKVNKFATITGFAAPAFVDPEETDTPLSGKVFLPLDQSVDWG